jgi:hypothetical protein
MKTKQKKTKKKEKRTKKSLKEKTFILPIRKIITEEEELMESLIYFQNKYYQTKEDKEAIRMIKLMLKNRK